jgi:hypothetical protein
MVRGVNKFGRFLCSIKIRVVRVNISQVKDRTGEVGDTQIQIVRETTQNKHPHESVRTPALSHSSIQEGSRRFKNALEASGFGT